MNKNIEHYIFHKENFLEESFCETCIDELNAGIWEKHSWYDNRKSHNHRYEEDTELDVLFLSSQKNENIPKINDFILQQLHSTILEYIDNIQFDWFDGWEGYSDVRFNRYSPRQEMRNHCDHIHSLFDGKRKGIPTLSIIGILNDEYEGGELIMCEDKKIGTKRGDLLIFPSNFLYPHRIAPVTKGVRYSYVSWVW